MIPIILPQPPQPTSQTGIGAWQQAVYRWMADVKLAIEAASAQNAQPVAPFQVGSYTAVSTITGTDETSNFVATLVAAMQASGLVAPTATRGSS
jgi:hypothetical protein